MGRKLQGIGEESRRESLLQRTEIQVPERMMKQDLCSFVGCLTRLVNSLTGGECIKLDLSSGAFLSWKLQFRPQFYVRLLNIAFSTFGRKNIVKSRNNLRKICEYESIMNGLNDRSLSIVPEILRKSDSFREHQSLHSLRFLMLTDNELTCLL